MSLQECGFFSGYNRAQGTNSGKPQVKYRQVIYELRPDSGQRRCSGISGLQVEGGGGWGIVSRHDSPVYGG